MLTHIVSDVLDDPFMYVVAVLLAAMAGGGIAWLLKRRAATSHRSRLHGHARVITVGEFIAGMMIVMVVIAPGMDAAMTEVAKSNAVSGYHENLRGSAIFAGSDQVPCEEDGSCEPTYQCHEYWVNVKVTDGSKTVNDGYDPTTKTYKTHQEEIYHYELQPRWHQCPFIKYVTDYWVLTTFGDKLPVATHVLPTKLQSYEGQAIPSSIQPHAPPEYWTRVDNGRKTGRPVPVAKDHTYINYLDAAQAACPHDYSDKFEKYRSRGLLVDHTENYDHPINNDYDVNGMVFAKKAPPNKAAFEAGLSMQNAELGMERHGDMHVVAVPNSEVNIYNADEYAGTLCSWWQDPSRGKYGLAKNTIMVVVGVSDDFTTIEWSRAFTGIPLGNGPMLSALTNELAGKVPFTPEALFGDPTATIDGHKVTYHHSDGAIEHIVLDEYPFDRPCMITCEAGQQGGFQYVSAAIMLTTWDKVWLQLATLAVCMLLWLIFAMVAFRREMFVGAYQYVRNQSGALWERVVTRRVS